MSRTNYFIMLSIIFLAACGPVILPTAEADISRPPTTTPGLAISPTATALLPTLLSKATVTATPSATPTPSFGDPPKGETTDYNLKPWNASDIWGLIHADTPAFPRNDADQGYDSQGDWATVKLTLLREIEARVPGSSNAANAETELISPNTYNGVSIPVDSTIELFRAALEAALNADANVASAPEILDKYISELLPSMYKAEIFPAPNVFGDDQPGWIFGVRGDGYASAFALSGSPGHYRLVSPDKNWRMIYWGDQAVSTNDLNANGIPEVAVHDSYWGTGMTHYCGEVLHVYEWQGDRFADLTPNLSTSAGTDSGGCSDFQFDKGPNGIQSITTGNWIASSCSTDNTVNIGALRIKRRYEWNRIIFELTHTQVLPMDSDLAGDQLMAHCRLNWVNEAGATNDQAYQVLPNLLEKTDPTSVAGYEDNFGPAYLDFFRFKLGTWYAMRGQQTRALALLKQVRDKPINPDYGTASKLAAAFLQAYPEQSPYAGCLLANKVINIYDYGGGDYLDVEKMSKDWGFFDWQWAYGGGYAVLFNGTGMREDTLNICNLSDAFTLAVRRQTFTSSEELISWLKMQHIPYANLIEGDVDGDGKQDWIAALGTGRNQRLDIWVLRNQDNSIQPLFVKSLDSRATNLPATWNVFTSQSSAPRLNVYQWPDGLLVFQVKSKGNWSGIETLLDTYPWDQAYLSFTIKPAENSASLENVQELVIKKSGQGLAWKDDWETYQWDSSLNAISIVSYPDFEQKQLIIAAENLLFKENKPEAALEIIKKLLSSEYDLIDADVDAYKSLPTVRPYLLYLLGVAHEMNGEKLEALSAFWTLWHNFPLHPLSYVVQQRLYTIAKGSIKYR